MTPPGEAIAAPQVCYRHCYASFPVSWVRQKVVPLPTRVSLLHGIYLLTNGYPDLQAIAVQRRLYHRLTRLTARSTLFSCLVVFENSNVLKLRQWLEEEIEA